MVYSHMGCCSAAPIPPCAPVFIALFVATILLMAAIVTVIMTVAYCRIFSKAGYCWAWGLLTLVPIANIIILLVLAFSNWPVLKELRQLRQQGGTAKL